MSVTEVPPTYYTHRRNGQLTELTKVEDLKYDLSTWISLCLSSSQSATLNVVYNVELSTAQRFVYTLDSKLNFRVCILWISHKCIYVLYTQFVGISSNCARSFINIYVLPAIPHICTIQYPP